MHNLTIFLLTGAGIILSSGGIFFFLLGLDLDECSNRCTRLTGLKFSSPDSASEDASVIASDVRSIVALETWNTLLYDWCLTSFFSTFKLETLLPVKFLFLFSSFQFCLFFLILFFAVLVAGNDDRLYYIFPIGLNKSNIAISLFSLTSVTSLFILGKIGEEGGAGCITSRGPLIAPDSELLLDVSPSSLQIRFKLGCVICYKYRLLKTFYDPSVPWIIRQINISRFISVRALFK